MVEVRPANVADIPLILNFILALAEYEKLAHEVVATEQSLRENLFADNSPARCLLLFSNSQPAGFALYFYSLSTFLGRKGIYLEDLFVMPQFRGQGFGKRLLQELAALTLAEKGGRLEWSVLDWNQPAIDFYQSLGAVAMNEWTVYRVTGPALQKLGQLETTTESMGSKDN